MKLIKPLAFVACLLPATWLAWGAVQDRLGANPVEAITHETGVWTLRFLLVTLTVTPLRRLSGWNGAIRLRRMCGLFAFFYGCLHFTTYLWLDQSFDVSSITKDVVKRPFITAGFTAFTLMIPLAATSTAAMVRRLGGKRWQRLHRLIYVSAAAGVVHYLWLVKADVQRPVIYGFILAILLAYRVTAWQVRHASTVRLTARLDAPKASL